MQSWVMGAFSGGLERVVSKNGLKSAVVLAIPLTIISIGDVLTGSVLAEEVLYGNIVQVVGLLLLMLSQIISYRLLWSATSAGTASGNLGIALFWWFVSGLIVAVLVAIGTLLLVIPGIYLLISFIFAGVVIALEGAGPLGALERSWQIATGRRWGLLLVGIVTVLVLQIGQVLTELTISTFVLLEPLRQESGLALLGAQPETVIAAIVAAALVTGLFNSYVFALQVECYDRLSSGNRMTKESTTDAPDTPTAASEA